jgi:hypothetical protein
MTDQMLLPVIGQHLLAGPAEPAAMLFQTPQNDRVAVVDDSSAETRDIARAGVVPLLCRRRCRPQNERQNQEDSIHLTAPHVEEGRDQIPKKQALSMREKARGAKRPACRARLHGCDIFDFERQSRFFRQQDTRSLEARQPHDACVGEALTTIFHK